MEAHTVYPPSERMSMTVSPLAMHPLALGSPTGQSYVQPAANRRQESRQHRAGSREQAAQSRQQRAGSNAVVGGRNKAMVAQTMQEHSFISTSKLMSHKINSLLWKHVHKVCSNKQGVANTYLCGPRSCLTVRLSHHKCLRDILGGFS